MDPVTLNSILFATRLLQLGLFKLIRLGNLNYENILSEGCSRSYVFKRFFIYKYIKIIFFIFKKFIFNIKISKKSKNIKNNNLKLKKS
jgi:hypothetical protein